MPNIRRESAVKNARRVMYLEAHFPEGTNDRPMVRAFRSAGDSWRDDRVTGSNPKIGWYCEVVVSRAISAPAPMRVEPAILEELVSLGDGDALLTDGELRHFRRALSIGVGGLVPVLASLRPGAEVDLGLDVVRPIQASPGSAVEDAVHPVVEGLLLRLFLVEVLPADDEVGVAPVERGARGFLGADPNRKEPGRGGEEEGLHIG